MIEYTFGKINLPGPAGTYVYISVNGVDAAGLAVGNYGDTNDDFHGFTANSGTPVIFDPPGSSNTNVGGITASGEIYGNYTNQYNQQVGFTYANGTFALIDAPLAEATTVFGVTGGGEVFGGYVDIFGQSHGFTDNNGVFTQVDAPGAVSTTIMGATASGELVGTMLDSADTALGFVDNNGSFATIEPAGAVSTYVVGVSATGVIAGTYEDNANNQYGFVDANGLISSIAISGATATAVTGISASGEVVGYYIDSAGNVHGFVDDLGSITTVDVPGASETDILGVNDAGDIYGYYNDGSGQHGFVGTSTGTTTAINQIDEIYGAVLQRGPTNAEVTAAESTSSATQLIADLVNSAEAQQYVYPIAQTYQLAFGTLPSAAALNAWVDSQVGEPGGFLTLAQIASIYVASDGFAHRFDGGLPDVDPNSIIGLMPNAAPLVTAFYSQALQETPTSVQLNAWVNSGLSVSQVFLIFATSAGDTANSQLEIQQYLTAAADDAAGIQVTGSIADVNHGAVAHV